MEYICVEDRFPSLSGCVVTLGKFDGLHKGHHKLLEETIKSKNSEQKAVLCAFTLPGPRKGTQILTNQERYRYLSSRGLDLLLECRMDESFLKTGAEDFITEVLLERLHVKKVVVGEDFHFGYQRLGNPGLLAQYGKKYGFETKVIPDEMDGENKISSTYIRRFLKTGDIKKVNDLLGYSFFADGIILHGRGIGHKVLFPTANIVPSIHKCMPANGVYLTKSEFTDRSFYGVTDVGVKPTVGGDFLAIESYLFDCDEDLYGRPCRVSFLDFLRPEKKFASLEELKKQMTRDIDKAKKCVYK